MFLAKLRAVVAVGVVLVVGAGVVGLAYQTGAAEPKQPAAPNAAPAVADDLESLRLEVEALRKSLQATRERVKVLEDEMQVMRGKGGMGPQPMAIDSGFPVQRGADPAPQDPRFFAGGFRTNRGFTAAEDPLAGADEALKKLHANPDDKQAADALEKALQRLRERKKPTGATGNLQAK
jgi:hypothetical protein